MNYDGRVFRSISNSAGGDVDRETLFHYHQSGQVVWATYSGGAISFGTLVAAADEAGCLDMRYQHLAADGTFRAGRCESRPEMLPDGRLRLHERWRWSEGADGYGTSLVEEVQSMIGPRPSGQ